MLLINNDYSKNVLYVTLQEMQLGGTNKYLLELENNLTKDKVYTVLTDRSARPERFQVLCLTTLTGSANPLNGEVNTLLEGFYNYTFFELNPDNIVTSSEGLQILEFGKAKVIKSPVTASSFNEETEYRVFDYEQYT